MLPAGNQYCAQGHMMQFVAWNVSEVQNDHTSVLNIACNIERNVALCVSVLNQEK